MPLKATCPSCGAPVVFQSTASLHAVCEFCRSTLVRHGTDLENLGRMADLLADASPLQLGTEGVYQGIHFALIGRIQLKYEAGLWNEWHLLFDDQKSGWLSDANGEYLISFLTPPQREIPAFENLQPEQRLPLAGREWQVTNTEQALCIAGEGELPFAFGAGYPAALVDLRTTDGQPGFASIDFSETPPLLFVGSAQPFDTFNFAKLRGNSAPAQSAGPVRALACPKCGSAITLHDPAIQSVACPACLTVLAPENDGLAILHKAAAERVKPKIPLGSRGRFEGHDWTVIGFQQREIAPANSYPPWQEYLLHHPQQGFRWLVEASGHWSWVRVLDTLPRYHEEQPSATLQGTEFTRYGTGEAITRFVIGEFNWRIRVGETWQTLDLVAPPQMLSREKNASEVSWSLGEYRTPEEIAAAFKLPQALPEAKGIGAIQPNPRIEPHRRTTRYFGLFLLLIVLAQVGWFIFGSRTLHEERLLFNPANDSTVTSKNFVLDRPARTLALTHETTLDNNWLGLNLALVEKRSGQAWQAASEISYWHGYDDGYWSEGSEKHELVFRDLPAGEYYLVIDPEFSENNPAPVGDRIAVVRDTTAWSNFLIALIALCAFWLISLYRKAAFETARWAEADFSSKGAVQSADDDTDSGSDD
jgi:ribosomal protein S27E